MSQNVIISSQNKPNSSITLYLNGEFPFHLQDLCMYSLLLKLAEMEATKPIWVEVCPGWSLDAVFLLNRFTAQLIVTLQDKTEDETNSYAFLWQLQESSWQNYQHT